jgi:methionyl-tRNA formyltransferase
VRGVFFGTSAFAVPSLLAFAQRVDCALVVTQPDRPAGRGQRLASTPVKVAAHSLGIRTLEPERLRDTLPELAVLRPDLFAVASYGKIVPQAVLDLARLGALNVHPSLLPCYRGATPLQSQIRDGVSDSGVTIIAMDAGMDTGDIVLAERSPIGPRETYGSVHDRFAQLGADLLARACDAVVAGRARPLPQALFGSAADAERTRTRTLTKAALEIDWTASARAVVDRIRSLAPAPGARAHFAGPPDANAPADASAAPPLKILQARVAEPHDLAGERDLAAFAAAPPGTLLAGRFVATGSGFVVLERLVPPGRSAVTGEEFARSPLAIGRPQPAAAR